MYIPFNNSKKLVVCLYFYLLYTFSSVNKNWSSHWKTMIDLWVLKLLWQFKLWTNKHITHTKSDWVSIKWSCFKSKSSIINLLYMEHLLINEPEPNQTKRRTEKKNTHTHKTEAHNHNCFSDIFFLLLLLLYGRKNI